jgi:hypothetical protein
MTARQAKRHSPGGHDLWRVCNISVCGVERIGQGRGGDEDYSPPSGSPEVVTHPRLPQNVACRFATLRSSKDDSQRGDTLQLPIRKEQLRSHKGYPRFDLLEYTPCDVALPAPVAEHSVRVAFHDPTDPPVRVRSPLASAGALFGDFRSSPEGAGIGTRVEP